MPLELMLRVTSVTGNGSGSLATRRSRMGSDSAARGALRRSSTTPTACVGTRANRRGPGLPVGDDMGTVLLSKLRSGETDANRPFHCGAAPIEQSPKTCLTHPPERWNEYARGWQYGQHCTRRKCPIM